MRLFLLQNSRLNHLQLASMSRTFLKAICFVFYSCLDSLPQDGVVLVCQILESFVKLVCSDQFYFGDDVVFVTEVNHSLSVQHSADQGAADTQTLEQELYLTDAVRLQKSSDLTADSLRSK